MLGRILGTGVQIVGKSYRLKYKGRRHHGATTVSIRPKGTN